ncbi:hypothetical protein BpHYR1_016962 [Brachionus plicatilis]|uniref:Uncharacterized protein n=1 Tax=Brachionus plicatilis TaxID=10195 RepID=A0A3M7QJ45_BRAPC|nr:hypothetical protein BpHYR1_016962 [Brachionus plicatilis]
MSQGKKSTNISVENIQPISPSNQKNLNQQNVNQTPRVNGRINQRNDLNTRNQNQTPRQANSSQSPTRFGEGTRIAKRELWWKEPPPSRVKIQSGQVFRPQNVGPKVDDRNLSYQTPVSQKTIEKVKLDWKAQPAVDTWGNFRHQPLGGGKKYPSESLQWQAQPKIDSGFIYYFEQ